MIFFFFIALALTPYCYGVNQSSDSRLLDAGQLCHNQPWTNKTISWCLFHKNIDSDNFNTIKSIIRNVFEEWELPDVTYIESEKCNHSDSNIKIIFKPHNDANKTLAIADKPPFGHLYVNSNNEFSLWYPKSPGSYDGKKPLLFSVLLQQVGRALGLCYSLSPNDVMYYAYQNDKQSLHPNDVLRLTDIYYPRKDVILVI